jgi:hypothetical protein
MDSHSDFNCTWIRSEKQIGKCLDLMRKNASDEYMTVEDLRCGRLTEDLKKYKRMKSSNRARNIYG